MTFPNLKHKHKEDSMFSPKEYMQYRKRRGDYPSFKIPEGVIICYQSGLLDYIIKNHKVTKVEDGFAGQNYLLNDTNNKILVIGKFGTGAPVTSLLVEELIAFGVKKIISVGTAGTLQKNIKIGDLVVCDKAIRDEGTSHHYFKHSKYAHASKEMTEKIKKAMNKLKLKYHVGTSWTIDAPYRETVAEARQYQKEGVLTVEMEAAALFSIAKYRGAQMGVIFTISDSLAELEWIPRFKAPRTQKGLNTLYKIALNVLLKK